jgi:putative transposase
MLLWRLHSCLTGRDLAGMVLQRGIVLSHEALRDWEAKPTPVLADELRQRRRGKGGARGRPSGNR